MKKIISCLLLILAALLPCAEELSEEALLKIYSANKKAILTQGIYVQSGMVFLHGQAYISGSEDVAEEMAEMNALDNIFILLEKKVDWKPLNPSTPLRRAVFENWRSIKTAEATLANEIEIDSYEEDDYWHYIACYDIEDVDFLNVSQLSIKTILEDFKENIDKVDPLIFYELIHADLTQEWQEILFDNMQENFGTNFAKMFFEKEIDNTINDAKQYNAALAEKDNLDETSSMTDLVMALNVFPYDKKTCGNLGKKLKKLELPYCASRIEKLGKKEYHPVPIIIVKELTDVPKDIKAIFVASKSSILKAPYFEKDGHVFFCGKAQMRSSSVTSRNAARTMAKIYAEGNVVKLVATKISYKGTILEGRAKLQEVFFNKWQTIPSAQEAISKGLKPIYEVLDGKTVYYVLATENPDNLFCNGVPPTFEQMRKSVIEMPKRNELLVYEILDEKQLRGQLEQIAKNLDENVNPNFSLMFQGKPPRPVTEEKQKRGRDLLALMTSSASLDDLLDLTAFLPYDKELCKRLIEKLNALEMTRCSALLAQRLAEYPKIKAAEEQRLKDLAEKNVERVAVQAPAPAPQAEKASIDTPATEAESAKPPRQN